MGYMHNLSHVLSPLLLTGSRYQQPGAEDDEPVEESGA